jgi:branched-chain amino acid aminotransferase
MARVEAVRDGYDEAILLAVEGYDAEGSGENIFIAYGRDLETPPAANILEGITRDSILRLCEADGVPVREARMTRDRLYCADEAFFTGTAAEVTPIRECDHREIGEGKPGPVTRELQAAFKKAALGEDRRFEKWLTHVG